MGFEDGTNIEKQGLIDKGVRKLAERIDNMIPSASAHSFASAHADWTLSATEQLTKILTTTLADASANIIALPTAGRLFIVANGSGQANVIKATGQTGVTVASTKTAIVRGNGTDFVRVTADA